MTSQKHTTPHERFNSFEFSGVGSNEWYNPGEGDKNRVATRDEFIAESSEMRDPDHEYSRISGIDFRNIEAGYFSLLESAQDAQDDILYEQVARKLAELYRHKEVQRRLGGDAINEALSRHRAETMNEEIFGEAEEKDFAIVLGGILKKAEAVADQVPEAQELTNLIRQEVEPSGSFDFELKPETLTRLKQDLFAIIPGLEGSLAAPEKRNISMEEASANAQRLLDVTGMSNEGWSSAIIKGNAASSSAAMKRIGFGGNRPEFKSTTDMNAVIVHEVIGHGYRSFKAKQQEDPRRRNTMPGTVDFEEGLATGLEQLISGKTRIAGQRYLLAIGVGKGLDRGGEARDFRDTYEILYRTLVVNQATGGQEIDREAAKQKAYQECMRTRRGGAIDARDMSYFLGAKKAYSWMNSIAELPEDERRQQLEWVLSGKFDPTNDAQATLFRQDIKNSTGSTKV